MISRKAKEIPPFIVMDVLEKAQELARMGEDIIHLEVGSPISTHRSASRRPVSRPSVKGDSLHPQPGLIELREAIAEDYWKKYRAKVSPEQILVASGTSPALLLLFSALLEPGDEVILSNPYYACYPNFIRLSMGPRSLSMSWKRRGFSIFPR